MVAELCTEFTVKQIKGSCAGILVAATPKNPKPLNPKPATDRRLVGILCHDRLIIKTGESTKMSFRNRSTGCLDA